MKILDITAKNILENFQAAYFNQTNKRMIIGSEEFTLSSIFSYALESFTGLLNKSYKNAFTATAEGKYLDNLAARYGLSRHAEQWTNPFFGCQFKCLQANIAGEYAVGKISMEFGGHKYTNSTKVVYNRIGGWMSCIMKADKRHNDYMLAADIKAQATECIFDNTPAPIKIDNIAGLGLQQCGAHYENDELFRTYIQSAKYIYTTGVAPAFESVAKAYGDCILDAKCATQDQSSYYTEGIVDLYIKPDVALLQILQALGNTEYITNELKTIMTGDPLYTLTIGQQLRVHLADRRVPSAHAISVKLPARMKGWRWEFSDRTLEVAEAVRIKLASLIYYYNTKKLKIGEPLFWTEFQQDLVNPLSKLSTRKEDFGSALTDELWDGLLRDFTFEGISSGDTKVVVPAPQEMNHNFYIWLQPDGLSAYIAEIQYTVEELRRS